MEFSKAFPSINDLPCVSCGTLRSRHRRKGLYHKYVDPMGEKERVNIKTYRGMNREGIRDLEIFGQDIGHIARLDHAVSSRGRGRKPQSQFRADRGHHANDPYELDGAYYHKQEQEHIRRMKRMESSKRFVPQSLREKFAHKKKEQERSYKERDMQRRRRELERGKMDFAEESILGQRRRIRGQVDMTLSRDLAGLDARREADVTSRVINPALGPLENGRSSFRTSRLNDDNYRRWR